MQSREDIDKVCDYINNTLKSFLHLGDIIFTLNFEKEITKYGKIVHVFNYNQIYYKKNFIKFKIKENKYIFYIQN